MIFLLWLASCPYHQAYAEEIPALTAYFEQKITKVEARSTNLENSESVSLSDVNVDLSPTATFGVNGVVSLSISPELDLVLTPETP